MTEDTDQIHAAPLTGTEDIHAETLTEEATAGTTEPTHAEILAEEIVTLGRVLLLDLRTDERAVEHRARWRVVAADGSLPLGETYRRRLELIDTVRFANLAARIVAERVQPLVAGVMDAVEALDGDVNGAGMAREILREAQRAHYGRPTPAPEVTR